MFPTCEPRETLVIPLQGTLDTARCEQLEADVHLALAGASVLVVFDLTGVDFICSAFLRICVRTHKQAKTQGFRIVNVAPPIKRVFKIAGLDMMLQGE
jgi:anti-anti-sigma factor